MSRTDTHADRAPREPGKRSVLVVLNLEERGGKEEHDRRAEAEDAVEGHIHEAAHERACIAIRFIYQSYHYLVKLTPTMNNEPIRSPSWLDQNESNRPKTHLDARLE